MLYPPNIAGQSFIGPYLWPQCPFPSFPLNIETQTKEDISQELRILQKDKKTLPRTSYLCCSSKQCLEIHIRGSCTFYDLINYLDLIPWCISLWQKCNENLFDFHLLPEYGLKEDDTEFVLCVFNVYILDV